MIPPNPCDLGSKKVNANDNNNRLAAVCCLIVVTKPRGWGLAWQQKSPNLIYMYVMTFDYRHLIDKSVLDILKKILEDIQSNGISDDRSIYISFRTNAQGVVLSKPVKQKYPKKLLLFYSTNLKI